jgi:hypothetical protein
MYFYMSSLRALQGVKRSETLIDNEVLYSEWRPIDSCLCISSVIRFNRRTL